MSYVDPSGKLFRVADLDINSKYCANTIILYKESLNDYKLIFHLSKNDEYIVLPKSDDLRITLKVNDSDPINDAVDLYDYNLGCLILNTTDRLFESIADEHTKYTCTLTITVYTLLQGDSIYAEFKLPITILPGSEEKNSTECLSPDSKVESYYVTGPKHSKSVNPAFSKLVNYD